MFKFDFNQKDEFEALPDGSYEGTIDEATVKTSKKGESYISMKMKLTNNRVLFDSAFLGSSNPKAVEMAQKKITKIVSSGVESTTAKEFKTMQDVAKFLCKIPVKIEYKAKGKNEQGYDQFDIKYKTVDSKVAKQVATSSAANPY